MGVFPHWGALFQLKRWVHRNKEQVDKFTILPFDVLLEILQLVEWRDILFIRQVCKRLNDTSRKRELWIEQYHKYTREKEFRPVVEEPLGSYSSVELEFWVLRRRKADLDWKTAANSAIERQIRVEKHNNFVLLPGGRWFLIALPDGSVNCYDLDNPEMQCTVLIPSRENPDTELAHYCVEIDVDHTSPTLKFFMVNYPQPPSSPRVSPCLVKQCGLIAFFLAFGLSSHSSMDLMFWQVDLLGHGSTAFLKATFLRSFDAHMHEDRARMSKSSLHGSLFATITPRRFSQYLVIFDWKLSTSSLHCRTVLFPPCTDSTWLASVHILPDRRILVVSQYDISVFEIGSMDYNEPVAPVIPPQPTQPQWVLPCKKVNQSLKIQRIIDTQSISFVFHSFEQVYRSIIPLDVKMSPRLVEYVELPKGYRMVAAGTEKVLLVKDRVVLHKDNIVWKGEKLTLTGHEFRVPIVSRRINTPWLPEGVYSEMDEGIGRMVILLGSRYSIFSVVDISSFPPHTLSCINS